MENPRPHYSPPTLMDDSRPSLGFPLGMALLLIVIFSLSGVFSCCYRWDKLRSLPRFYWDDDQDEDDLVEDMESGGGPFTSLVKSNPLQSQDAEEKESLTVVMPGDQIAKFIAMPCPCRPPRLLPENEVVTKHQKLPQTQTALPLQ